MTIFVRINDRQMGLFNWFGEQEHNVFDYKPIYYDKEKDEREKKFGRKDTPPEDEPYVPGSYIKGSLRDGKYQNTRSTANKAQNIIGLVGLLLVVIVLIFIAKFYMLL